MHILGIALRLMLMLQHVVPNNLVIEVEVGRCTRRQPLFEELVS